MNLDKKKKEILDGFRQAFVREIKLDLGKGWESGTNAKPFIRQDVSADDILKAIDLALTELWNIAIDEAEKAVGGEVCSYRDCSCQKETQEIRINLRKLKIRG